MDKPVFQPLLIDIQNLSLKLVYRGFSNSGGRGTGESFNLAMFLQGGQFRIGTSLILRLCLWLCLNLHRLDSFYV
jgi:hypothetical protein